MEFSKKTIAASDLKGSKSWYLIKYIKIFEYWRSMSFLDLGPRSCTYKKLKWIFSETAIQIWIKFCIKAIGTRKWKFDDIILVTWPPHPYMVTTLLKPSSPEPVGRFPGNFVCSIRDSSPSRFVQLMTLEWPWPILLQGQIYLLRFFYGKNENSGFFINNCSHWPEIW